MGGPPGRGIAGLAGYPVFRRSAGSTSYLHGTDPSVQVPPAGLIRRGTTARPPTYSDAEIRAIMTRPAPCARFRAATYQTLIVLAVSRASARRSPSTAMTSTPTTACSPDGREIRENPAGPAAPRHEPR